MGKRRARLFDRARTAALKCRTGSGSRGSWGELDRVATLPDRGRDGKRIRGDNQGSSKRARHGGRSAARRLASKNAPGQGRWGSVALGACSGHYPRELIVKPDLQACTSA